MRKGRGLEGETQMERKLASIPRLHERAADPRPAAPAQASLSKRKGRSCFFACTAKSTASMDRNAKGIHKEGRRAISWGFVAFVWSFGQKLHVFCFAPLLPLILLPPWAQRPSFFFIRPIVSRSTLLQTELWPS